MLEPHRKVNEPKEAGLRCHLQVAQIHHLVHPKGLRMVLGEAAGCILHRPFNHLLLAQCNIKISAQAISSSTACMSSELSKRWTS